MAEQEIKPKQKIEYINIDKLVLWDDNPRDPFKKNASNQEIAERAISVDGQSKWKLKSFCESMGEWLDISEAPTVFYDGDKPVVYDGNRRVLIGKIIHGCVKVRTDIDFSKIDFPEEIPCNVCDEPTALKNVERKHVDDSSWGSLERDVFEHYYMHKKKSFFLVLDEEKHIISNNPLMNQRFVKDEIFSGSNMNYLNILVKNGTLQKPYSDSDFKIILDKIVFLVNTKTISTRRNRGQLINLLLQDAKVSAIIPKKQGTPTPTPVPTPAPTPTPVPTPAPPPSGVKTPRIDPKDMPIFGKGLSLESGITNNLYRDIEDMYNGWVQHGYSKHFVMLVRMGLRLLCEVAAEELTEKRRAAGQVLKKDIKLKNYIEDHFKVAKGRTKPEREFFNTQVPDSKTMITLLQKSAHAGSKTLSKEQTIALSIMLGRMLEKTHGTKK